MSKRSIDSYILPATSEAAAGKLEKHFKEIGTRYVFVDNRNYPETQMYVIARAVKNIEKGEEHIKPHTHRVDNLMSFIGDNDDLTGLTVEVLVGEERRVLKSPVSAYIPSGIKHNYRFVKGSGKYINIVLVPGGDYNSVTS